MLFGAFHSLSHVSKSHLWAPKTLAGNWAHCHSVWGQMPMCLLLISVKNIEKKNRATVRIPQIHRRHCGGWGGSTLLALHLLHSHPSASVGRGRRAKEEERKIGYLLLGWFKSHHSRELMGTRREEDRTQRKPEEGAMGQGCHHPHPGCSQAQPNGQTSV